MTITRDTLLRHLGRELGWGRNPSDWSDAKRTDAEDIIAKGLAEFYSPPLLNGERSQHEWTFLSPTAFISTSAGVADYDLPADFAGVTDDLTFRSDNAGWNSIKLVSDVAIRRRRQAGEDINGYPVMAAILPLPANGDEEQRWSITFDPIPDGIYELHIRYRCNWNAITASKPFPLGGQATSDALLASVIAAGHEYINDDPAGVYYAKYLERLRAAIATDRQRNIQSLGYCGDAGMIPEEYQQNTRLYYNGVEL